MMMMMMMMIIIIIMWKRYFRLILEVRGSGSGVG
jgi:hypothetical protein